jgi:hypothetical protein
MAQLNWMYAYYEDDLSWRATVEDMRRRFPWLRTWTIDVDGDGVFWVRLSDHDTGSASSRIHSPAEPCMTLAAAKAWCQSREDGYFAAVDEINE